MPIKEDSSKTSIEFMYENENGSIFQNIRYSYTEEHGPTVSLLGEDGSEVYSAPVDMFIDIVEFLLSKNVIKISNSLEKSRIKNEESFAETIFNKDIDPISSFSNSVPIEKYSIEEIADISMPSFEDKNVNKNNFNTNSQQKENDPSKYMEERRAAMQRAKTSERKITRKE